MKRLSSSRCYADITPKERAIANGQRFFVSFLLLQLSNSFLRILAVPNKAVFCNSPVLIVTPSFSSHASNLLLTTPSAPTTTGTTNYYYYYYCYYYYGSYTHLDARLKKKKNTTTTARRITVASSVYKFTKDILFKILYMNLLKILYIVKKKES